MRREQTQISKIGYEKGQIITNTKRVQGTISGYFEKPIFK
jgi:hypothetical protein